jgi:hypothetical protein
MVHGLAVEVVVTAEQQNNYLWVVLVELVKAGKCGGGSVARNAQVYNGLADVCRDVRHHIVPWGRAIARHQAVAKGNNVGTLRWVIGGRGSRSRRVDVAKYHTARKYNHYRCNYHELLSRHMCIVLAKYALYTNSSGLHGACVHSSV